jgi:hypothetical protein
MNTPLQIRPGQMYQKSKPVRTWHIYALKDPRTEEVRYIGVTTDPKRRFRKHLTSKDLSTPRARWIAELREAGLRPSQEIIETGTADSQAAEKRWILFYRAEGCDLTNTTAGGNGTAGYIFTPEARAKIGAGQRGRKHSDEWKANAAAAHRALNRKLTTEHKETLRKQRIGKCFLTEKGRRRISEANTGRTMSADHRERLSKINKGKTVSAATRGKLAAASTGKKMTVEARLKLSESLKGREFSSEHRAKLAIAAQGKRHPQEVLDRIAAKARGRKMPQGFGERMSAERKGKPWNDKRRQAQIARNGARPNCDYKAVAERRRGMKFSAEARANMKAAWERRREERTALNREVWAKRKAIIAEKQRRTA